jgi:predicted RNase H-like HicB family nuclease
MNKMFYPAIFHKEGNGFWVSFPDFPECFTEGDNMEEAYRMAVEALGLAITSRKNEKEALPIPTTPDKLDVKEGVLVVIEFDLIEYCKRHNSKAVKKTLSIPEWMNEAATEMGINFSQVLQEALMIKIRTKI